MCNEIQKFIDVDTLLYLRLMTISLDPNCVDDSVIIRNSYAPNIAFTRYANSRIPSDFRKVTPSCRLFERDDGSFSVIHRETKIPVFRGRIVDGLYEIYMIAPCDKVPTWKYVNLDPKDDTFQDGLNAFWTIYVSIHAMVKKESGRTRLFSIPNNIVGTSFPWTNISWIDVFCYKHSFFVNNPYVKPAFKRSSNTIIFTYVPDNLEFAWIQLIDMTSVSVMLLDISRDKYIDLPPMDGAKCHNLYAFMSTIMMDYFSNKTNGLILPASY